MDGGGTAELSTFAGRQGSIGKFGNSKFKKSSLANSVDLGIAIMIVEEPLS